MIEPHPFSKKSALPWLALVAALFVLCGVIVLNLYFERERTKSWEEDRLSAKAKLVADNLEERIASINQALLSIRSEISGERTTLAILQATLHINSLSRALPGVNGLSVVDAEGMVIAASRSDLAGADLRHRHHFQIIKQQAAPDILYVSPPFLSMTDQNGLSISRMIPGPRGEFAGIVSATIDPSYFKTLMSSVLYADDVWSAIVHGNGQLFLMEPRQKVDPGVNLAQPGSLFMRHRDNGQTATVLTGFFQATGEERMLAQRTINPSALGMSEPLVVAVSRDLDAIFQPWQRNALMQAMLFCILVLVSSIGLHNYQRRQGRLEQAAAEARAIVGRLNMALDRIPTFIYMKDRRHRYVYANRPTLELFKVAYEDLHDIDDSGLFPPDAAARLREIDTRVLEYGEDTAEEVVIPLPDGSERVLWEIKTPIYEDADKTRIWGLCGISTDITEHKELLEEFKLQANMDYLTGLANRRRFVNRGESALAQAKRFQRPLSLLMIDIDHFKKVNDTHGHKIGDLVLQQLAGMLRGSFRTVDIIGRIGGEEFAVLMPETASARAAEAAERMRQTVADADLSAATGLPLRITVSVGVSTLNGEDISLDRLMEIADRALYDAKQGGRNKVCVADS